MIVEMRAEYHDKYDNSYYEMIEVPVNDKEKNLECSLTDLANQWFFDTAKEVYKEEYGTFDDYLQTVKFSTDLGEEL